MCNTSNRNKINLRPNLLQFSIAPVGSVFLRLETLRSHPFAVLQIVTNRFFGQFDFCLVQNQSDFRWPRFYTKQNPCTVSIDGQGPPDECPYDIYAHERRGESRVERPPPSRGGETGQMSLTRLRSTASQSFSTNLADASRRAGSFPQNCTNRGRSSGWGSKLLRR